MEENIKKAHIARAKEKYNDENTETPGSFEQYFSGQYADEYGAENKKPDQNKKVVGRYLGYLANTRGRDQEERPGLLGKVQVEGKGPYPSNQEEDQHLLQQIMQFLHSDEIQTSIYKLLETSPEGLAKVISNTGANVAAKLIFEIRKQREVTEEMESSVVTIAIEELWTMAKNMGMKEISPELVQNTIRVAANIYNELEDKMKSTEQQPAQPVQGLEGQQQQGPPQQGPPQEMPQEGM